ncbi:glycerophosphodiester phosphodiesterase [Brevibacillus ruminantium]|uniref:Glycerophosphodiester phosphodiesterase n=1 Tax=Brevibacillus ruminantium TaxID=2950604 RepID=A0ABY4WH94_9BACL|nr:glycerophosphodiester phosphodiesterase family protein [Brevibacillus ruminantium]USG65513.1 glycerophosphodiester phosphodiesterase [Brevibacillus ruminantium]
MNVCMAHRGWSGKAPENTMTAIRLALAEPAIGAIEIDVQLSKDGIPVLFHDFTLERTSNGSGLISAYTYEELRALDAGSWFGERFAGERIPSLEEVLQAVKGRCTLNIELKTAPGMHPGLSESVLALLKRYDMRGEVYVTSFDHEEIRRFRSLDDEVRTGLIVYGNPVMLLEQLHAARATILSMAYPYLTEELASAALEQGVEIIAWTVDDPQAMRQLLKAYPDVQICTNHPERMLAIC